MNRNNPQKVYVYGKTPDITRAGLQKQVIVRTPKEAAVLIQRAVSKGFTAVAYPLNPEIRRA